MTFWVAGAVVVGGVVGAVASNKAANTQADAQNQATQSQKDMFNTLNAQEQPFIKAGQGATTDIQSLLKPGGQLNSSFTGADYLKNQDPGYQFQLQQGASAVRNADTPGVGALSGAALKDLIGFNQGMAATGYQNAWDRWNATNTNLYNRLYGVANLGQNAASNTGAVGSALGTGIAQSTAAAGASRAAGIVGGANAIGGSAVPLSYLLSNGSGGGGAAALSASGSGAGYTQSNGYIQPTGQYVAVPGGS